MATTGLGPLAAVDSADRAAREEHIARAKASSRACRALNLAKKEGQVGTRYGLRRVFEQERNVAGRGTVRLALEPEWCGRRTAGAGLGLEVRPAAATGGRRAVERPFGLPAGDARGRAQRR